MIDLAYTEHLTDAIARRAAPLLPGRQEAHRHQRQSLHPCAVPRTR